MTLNFKMPKPSQMYTYVPENGAYIEGRDTRKGVQNMKLSSLTKRYEVTDVRWSKIPVEELSFPVDSVTYRVHLETFVPLINVGDVRRYETVAFWKLSYNEILRHHALANRFIEDELWQPLLALRDSELEQIHDILCKWLDFIITDGDWSLDHFKFYVKEHADSASPFGGKWGDFLESKRQLQLAKDTIDIWIRDFVTYYKKLNLKQNNYIRAKFTYPSVRARPGEMSILQQDAFSLTGYVSKWRDRKVGGVLMLSQLTYPLFKIPAKKQAAKIIDSYLQTILPGVELHSLALEGPQTYLDLMAEDEIYLYDMKTAEKQTGLLLQQLGFAVDLSSTLFSPEVAAEIYSGIGPTSELNEIALGLVLRILRDERGIEIRKMYKFSDNVALDKVLPPQPYLEPADTFCGLLVKEQRFGPTSLVTDNPKHRLSFHGNQKQVQRVQYFMRPFMTIVMNDLTRQGTTKKFLQWVVAKDLYIEEDPTSYRKDHLKELILNEGSIEERLELHNDLWTEFDEVHDFMSAYFYTQNTNPNFSTDLKVYD